MLAELKSINLGSPANATEIKQAAAIGAISIAYFAWNGAYIYHYPQRCAEEVNCYIKTVEAYEKNHFFRTEADDFAWSEYSINQWALCSQAHDCTSLVSPFIQATCGALLTAWSLRLIYYRLFVEMRL